MIGYLYLGVAALFGFLGYRQAEAYELRTGRPAWKLPSPVWALLWAFSVVLGLVLFAVATRGDQPRTDWRLLRTTLFVIFGLIGLLCVVAGLVDLPAHLDLGPLAFGVACLIVAALAIRRPRRTSGPTVFKV